MSEIICVTNRLICCEDFLTRIEKIAKYKPAPLSIILREKDLTPNEYENLAKDVLNICTSYNIKCILHNFVNAALNLKCSAIHLPLQVLRTLSSEEKKAFSTLGASCHSTLDAIEAEKLGCTYITAGHIFDTDCKKGLPGRGLYFLEEVCKNVSIPVYAIGGINSDNYTDVKNAGASGACILSGLMKCENVNIKTYQ